MSTVKAAFGRWIPLVNLDNGTPIPCSFVLKLSDKLRPTHVTDSFRQTVIFDHVLDVQTLDTYDLVLTYDLSREFVLIVPSAIRNLLVKTSNLETSFCTVLGTFFLFCVTALGFRQLLFLFGEELWVTMRMSIGGDTTRLASIGQGTMPRDVKGCIHLRQRESALIPGERIARIGSGLLIAFLFEGGIVSTPFKEIAKGFIQMSESLLERDRRNLIEPHRLFLLFEQYQTLRCALVVQALTMLVIGVSALSQCPVVDIATTSEGLRQDTFLLITWGEAILIGFFLFHTLQ